MRQGSYGVTAFALFKTLSISIPTVADALTGRLTIERCNRRLADWSRALVANAGVELEVRGAELVPRDRAFVFMSNHQSNFDVPVIFAVSPVETLRMVAKVELFRVPIWGRALRDAGFVSVDRTGDKASKVAAMKLAADAVQSGVSIWVAPEGTRSRDGRLGEFKKGGFILAQETGAPIVPMAIDGTKEIFPKNTMLVRRGAKVRVTFGAPIALDGRDLPSLMAEVRQFMLAHVSGAE